MEELVVKAIRDETDEVRRAAVELAGVMRSDAAVPEIGAVFKKDTRSRAEHALVDIGSDAAVKLLLDLSRSKDPDERARIAQALVYRPIPKTLKRLREMLDDREETGRSDYRVCDHAAETLSAWFQTGPGFKLYDERAVRDKKITEWKDYMGKK
jgi:HEAT repeat protein